MLYGIPRVHFFFLFSFFFRRDLVRAISLEPSLVETPDSVCCLVLQSNFALLLTIQFASLFFFLFFFLFFSAKILSGPYLWNRYSQRLQIECAAWSCSLILHYCLPSSSLGYLFIIFGFSATILSGPYFWNRYSQRLQIECAAWSCGLIVHCCLPSNSLR